MGRTDARLYPALLRHWRMRRGFSQLDLAVAADVSSRHVSFLETGRAKPSRDMVLRLAATLDVPLRDQNDMMRAAGFPPEFEEIDPAGALPASVERALQRMFAVHDPFPITLLDRRYDVLRVNENGKRLLSRFVADPQAMPTPINVFRLVFDPRLARPFIVDWERVAHGFLARLHREALTRPTDRDLGALLQSLFEYPEVPEAWRQPDFSTQSEAVLTLQVRRGDLELSFLTTMTTFSAPQNVTLEELRVESYFPLDATTERLCASLA